MSAPGTLEEAWADDCLLCFDGRVLEVFGFPGSESIRFHVANLDLDVSGPDRNGRYDLMLKPVRGGGGCMLQVGTGSWPAVAPLVAGVAAAAEAARGGSARR